MSEEVHGQSLSDELVEKLRALFPEDGDLSREELILEQECVLQSLKLNATNRRGILEPGQSSDRGQFSWQEGEHSQSRSLESQLAQDEAVAKFLEEFGDELDESHISEIFGHIADSSRETPDSSGETPDSSGETPAAVRSPEYLSEDEVDPDEMTYENLQSLGDSIGAENKGLSEEFISSLPSSKYKTGFLSNKEKNEECVICCMTCENGEYVITLPCIHQYHTECIKKWLKLHKTCPICKEEVCER